MGRRPCCAKEGLNRGAWTPTEDRILTDYIKSEGEGKWRILPQRAGLKRCGKSCRLRWLNYLRPDIKRGNISSDEEDLIIRLHKLLGNRWSLIAGRLPGRTDNEIKNYWNTNLSKKAVQGAQVAASGSGTKRKPSNPEMVPSCAIRTKARRCTKVFLDADLIYGAHLELGLNIIPVKAPPSSSAEANRDFVYFTSTHADKNVDPEPPSGGALTVPPTLCGGGCDSDFMMDFEMDKFLSDFLNTDLACIEDGFEKGLVHDNESNDFTPKSSQDALLHDDHDSDLGSMAALLAYPIMDWLHHHETV